YTCFLSFQLDNQQTRTISRTYDKEQFVKQPRITCASFAKQTVPGKFSSSNQHQMATLEREIPTNIRPPTEERRSSSSDRHNISQQESTEVNMLWWRYRCQKTKMLDAFIYTSEGIKLAEACYPKVSTKECIYACIPQIIP
ncbi:hypothetical protein L9F63_022412, partial [Diploptera punctata]